MGKVLAWALSLTGLGKVVTPVQSFLSGKKSYIAGAGLAIPALLTIISNFSVSGMDYLVRIPSTEEFKMLLNGIAVMGIRAAITKAADPATDPNSVGK